MTEAKRLVLGSAETAIHHELMDQARLVDRALAKATDALKRRDLELAQAVVAKGATTAERVAAEDDTVDAMARELAHRVLADIATSTTEAGCGARLLWMSRSLERIADHVTDIAERVVFMVTGQTKELG